MPFTHLPPQHPTPTRARAESINAGRVSKVETIEGCCVLAAVGQGMVAQRGVSATMMGALAKANVNIKAIAQVGLGSWVFEPVAAVPP